jgi:phosphoribosylanthranilate isomerase
MPWKAAAPAGLAWGTPAAGVKVKICGITNWEDAKASVDAGADALGFNFYAKSPRYVPLKQAAAIVAKLPPFVAAVALFVNPSEGEVLQALRAARWGALQFHGDEDPNFLSAFPWDLQIKASRLDSKTALKELRMGYARSGAWLLDAPATGLYGGSGKLGRWDLAKLAMKEKKPVILAGGLKPENVAEAVKAVRPWGVDTASGVEKAPGKKDFKKVQTFVLNAKRALQA